MSYIHFDKILMSNLQSSLWKEFLITNRQGAYCSTTIVGCNLRKYHGLMVTPLPDLDDENHVLLSSLDETVIQHGAEFNLGVHQYQGGNLSPKGHKYITSFDWDKCPTWMYRIGGVVLRKEIVYRRRDHLQIYIRYTLVEAHSKTTLRLRPYLAFRSVRQWTHENGVANTGFREVDNGIAMRMYEGYPELFMQTSEKAQFVYTPDWYRGLEYPKENERGYHDTEDLFVPGYFEMEMKKGESIIFSAAIHETEPGKLERHMEIEMATLDRHDSFFHSLVNAAHQFRVEDGDDLYLLSGFHWFKPRGRDTFIAIPGLTLSIGENLRFEQYMETALKAVEDVLARRPVSVRIYEMEQPDVLLWCIWCIQQYAKFTSVKECAEKYGRLVGRIIEFIQEGKHENLIVHGNGLLYSHGKDHPVTWMNSMANGRPIAPRTGYIVEFNALWYNALKFHEELLRTIGDADRISLADYYAKEAEKVSASFRKTFLNQYGYLFDYVDGNTPDWCVRPNQIFAISLDYSPLDRKQCKSVLDICTKELVTPKGIRSLSPKSGGYTPFYRGSQAERDQAYHQGTAWPWLTGFYLEAYLKVYKMSGVNYIERQLIGFEEELFYHSIGTIPELFDGNPSFSGRGAVSLAINVSGILRANRLLEDNQLDNF